ncbi:PTS system N-acetylmuramic acid-specific EIIBC component [Spiroplasma sabaudiense Ar-1343]|uniref:PTS system N-acetylmuramic acid-specific EIIBC component n=1 Tax=Spiroplasma sabaudiense Ar-1343 TaxID=1276257 RepID=W6AAU5_9MOLU|nr:PTS transporter subunit EIIC [Spiroplasma sabaudiense]AHI54283.1 PTS system N-acetylmuramic acid-specific EIIBC component [Spiroplasma sabaudiense Ar-1343]
MKNAKNVANQICDIIGKENISSFTNCMTRLRVKVINKAQINLDVLKSVSGVLGVVVVEDQMQIILGPGFVNKVAVEFAKLTEATKEDAISENLDGNKLQVKSAEQLGSENKSKYRNKNRVQTFLSKISKVFTPLIPAFIGAGILSGIAGIMLSQVPLLADKTGPNWEGYETLKSWWNVMSIGLTILTNVFIIAVGWRIGEEWGGNPGISALMAAMFCTFVGPTVIGIFVSQGDSYNFLGMIINKADIEKNWFTVGFVNFQTDGTPILGAAHAGLIGAMISAGVTVNLEKAFRRFMPGAIDTILTPIIVVFSMILINFLLIIPIAGYLFTAISWLFINIYQNPFGAAFLAGIFLIALTFGVHQGFLPVYFALIQETGVNGLFPIMCMGGTSMVGVSIGLWLMAGKNSILRKQITGAIIPGFLGIGEPLLYGICLPRVRPFVVACITAAFGGFYMGAMSFWGGINVGMNSATGPGGLTAAIMMTTIDGNIVAGVLTYLSGLVLTYILGATFCWFAYSKIALNGSKNMKAIFQKNGDYQLSQKIGYGLAFATVFGIFISWIIWFSKMPKADRKQLESLKLK